LIFASSRHPTHRHATTTSTPPVSSTFYSREEEKEKKRRETVDWISFDFSRLDEIHSICQYQSVGLLAEIPAPLPDRRVSLKWRIEGGIEEMSGKVGGI
jgi:hypothetical protein